MSVSAQVFSNFIAALINAHKGHIDKGGKPYVLHLIRVMMRLRTEDFELMMMAIGHDGMEDEVITREELLALGATPRVMRVLDLLNHNPSVPYQDYIVKIGEDYDAIRIKIEDIKDNSDITRMKPYVGNSVEERIHYEQKQIARMRKYQIAYEYLVKRRYAFENP